MGRALALCLMLVALMAMVLSAAPPAAAATPSGKAFAWGYNSEGQLGNGTSGAGTDSDVPVSVKNLSNVISIDGGDYFTLAATQ